MNLSIIVSMAKNRVIGRNNAIPWHITEDYVRTRKKTEGHPIILGRNNFISISGHKSFEGSDGKEIHGYKPLPKRTNIILSHKAEDDKRILSKGSRSAASTTGNLFFVSSIDEALEIAQKSPGAEEIFIFGGASIYEQFLPMAKKMYITLIDEEIEGDVFFPQWDELQWKRVKRIKRIVRVEDKVIQYQFIEYTRNN